MVAQYFSLYRQNKKKMNMKKKSLNSQAKRKENQFFSWYQTVLHYNKHKKTKKTKQNKVKSKRKQSKRKQSKRKQSKRKQSKRKHRSLNGKKINSVELLAQYFSWHQKVYRHQTVLHFKKNQKKSKWNRMFLFYFDFLNKIK